MTAFIITVVCLVFYMVYTRRHVYAMIPIDEEIGEVYEIDDNSRQKLDREYKIWKCATIIVTVIALLLFMSFHYALVRLIEE